MVVLGDVAMGIGARMVVVGLRRFVGGGDVAVGEWHGHGRALVIGGWSSLLLGPWQPRPVRAFRGQEGEGNGQGD